MCSIIILKGCTLEASFTWLHRMKNRPGSATSQIKKVCIAWHESRHPNWVSETQRCLYCASRDSLPLSYPPATHTNPQLQPSSITDFSSQPCFWICYSLYLGWPSPSRPAFIFGILFCHSVKVTLPYLKKFSLTLSMMLR